MKIMSRILTYLLLSGLFAVGIYAGYLAIKVEDKPKITEIVADTNTMYHKIVTRQAVDSLTMAEYKAKDVYTPQPIKEPIKWNEITATIVALTVAGAGLKFGSFKKEVYKEFSEIKAVLETVIDNKYRKSIDDRLLKIEHDAVAFVDDENIKTYIEGMGYRTRLFCNDVMTMNFTHECFESAKNKMNARNCDGKHQAKDLGFSDYFQKELNALRLKNTKQLDVDLERLCNDHIHNNKYERFGDIICRFYTNYSKGVIKLHYETKQA